MSLSLCNSLDCRDPEPFPVRTSPDNSCFVNSFARLLYGSELHANEMRVRVVVEAVTNEAVYIDHRQVFILAKCVCVSHGLYFL